MAPGQLQQGESSRWRWLALLGFLCLFAVLFAVFAIVQGVGAPKVPAGSVAIVEGVPDELGDVTKAEFQQAMVASAAQAQIDPLPKPGEEQYDSLREAALRSLFDPIWIRGQAEEMGISVSQKEIDEEMAAQRENYATKAEYEEFLEKGGYTKASLEELVTTGLLSSHIGEQIEEETPPPSQEEIESYYAAAKSTKLVATADGSRPLSEVEAKIEKRLSERAAEKASADYLRGYLTRWTARTYCAKGYAVVNHCVNFVTDGHPPNANPACYEADPKGGAPESCPAPVIQARPAMPGSVSPLNPEGTRLAQAPFLVPFSSNSAVPPAE